MYNEVMNTNWFLKLLAFTGIVIVATQWEKDQEELEMLREEREELDNNSDKMEDLENDDYE